MKNRAKKIIAISLGGCFWALWFVFLFFVVTKPYTEKVVIWLPDNYELENNVTNEVVSIIPPIDNQHQSNEVFCSRIGMESFKRLFGNNKKGVSVKIEDTGHSNPDYYQIIYQTKYDCADKMFVVTAQGYYKYNKTTLLEMGLKEKDRALFLKNKRDTNSIYFLSILGFIVIGLSCLLFCMGRGSE